LNAYKRRRLLRFGAWFVLLAAVLPNVAYVGHWPGSGDGHSHAESHESHSEVIDHALHCHVGPAKCVGGQAMVGAYWIGEDAGLLSLYGPDVSIEAAQEGRALAGAAQRLLHPPQQSA
jgi:hypothetical protein